MIKKTPLKWQPPFHLKQKMLYNFLLLCHQNNEVSLGEHYTKYQLNQPHQTSLLE